MRKLPVLISLICSLMSASVCNAGLAGEAPKIYTFFGVEGGYSWNDIDSIFVRTIDTMNGINSFVKSSKHDSGGTVRVYTGIMRLIHGDNLYFSGEVGWGYYGETKLTLNPLIVENGGSGGYFRVKDTFTGFDALVGLILNKPEYDVFIKAGALVQNSNLKTNISGNLDGDTAQLYAKMTATQALPEVKVGGSYHVNDNLLLTAAYAHAFGYPMEFDVQAGDTEFARIKASLHPSLDILTVGVQYRFA